MKGSAGQSKKRGKLSKRTAQRRPKKILNHQKLDTLFARFNFTDYRWIKASQIEVAHWVRFKCTFGCTSYGNKGTCPPQVPSVEECRAFFDEYSDAVIFHFAKKVDRPEDRVPWTRKLSKELVELERETFKLGYYKAFMLFMDECRLCENCTGTRDACINKDDARPGPEALGVDVFSTVRSIGYPIEVLQNYDQEMNRYAFLMVE
jgi:predicted metal-binding protein